MAQSDRPGIATSVAEAWCSTQPVAAVADDIEAQVALCVAEQFAGQIPPPVDEEENCNGVA